MSKLLSKCFFTLPFIFCLLCFSSCSFWTQAPLNFPTVTEYSVTPESGFEEISEVEGESCSYLLLLFIGWGDGGYIAAYNDALLKAPGADTLIDIKADIKVLSVLGIYSQFCTVIRGTAVKIEAVTP